MCKKFLPLVFFTMLVQFSQAQISYVPNEKCAMNEVEYNYSLTHPQYAQELNDFKQVIQYYSTIALPEELLF
jgi:predicted metal-binding protein